MQTKFSSKIKSTIANSRYFSSILFIVDAVIIVIQLSLFYLCNQLDNQKLRSYMCENYKWLFY